MIDIDAEIKRLHEAKAPVEAEADALRKKWMGRWPLDQKLKVAMVEAQRVYEATVVAYHASVAETATLSPFVATSDHPDYGKIIHDLQWLKNAVAEIDGDPIAFMESQPKNLGPKWDPIRKAHVETPSPDDYNAFHKAQVLRELKTRLEGFGYVFEDLIR